MKRIPKMAYTSPREALAEKFHMSEDLLATLNRGGHFDRPGEIIVVVDTGTNQNYEKADRVEVDKNWQTVKLFGQVERAHWILSRDRGRQEKPSPSGTLKVTEVDRNPTYHYNPAYHFKGVNARKPFVIAPGPKQSSRHCLDQSLRRWIRHSWHAVAREGLQI